MYEESAFIDQRALSLAVGSLSLLSLLQHNERDPLHRFTRVDVPLHHRI
ncbi:hypothetical protein VCR4J2_250029 [Vibrio coralliirubri]|nr:hypothetical protein VCR4J2_250029 [Vibrio coralliirubri]CDT31763.1 hypothetical protein VCR1J2_400074 [Vibrio coralliirubri]